jgi:hypothetical protein
VAQNKAKLFKTLIITFDLEKNANFFRRKLAKIAEISDHNIDPWLPQKQIRIFYFFFIKAAENTDASTKDRARFRLYESTI